MTAEIGQSNPRTLTPSAVVGRSVSTELDLARRRGRELELPYAGALNPEEAHTVLAAGGAVLVDVRTAEELKFVGSVPGSVHVAWQTTAAMIKNPRFLKELSAKVSQDRAVFFICRSGKRSSDAAAAAAKAGYAQAFNVLEGFDGDGNRDGANGWRNRGLPSI
jgi:rhodanese-related sulfurtransferase